MSHEVTAYLSVFDLFLTQLITVILSKGCKPDHFKSHNSLKLSFTIIRGLCSNFVECESFLESNTHDSLAVYVKEGIPFTQDLSLENSADSYLCFRLPLLHSVSHFFFLYQSLSLSLCTVFDSISSNIDEVLSINPFNSPILVELIDLVNYVITFLSQMTLLRWLTLLLGSLTVTLTVLLFWICFFLLMLVFVLQWLSLH